MPERGDERMTLYAIRPVPGPAPSVSIWLAVSEASGLMTGRGDERMTLYAIRPVPGPAPSVSIWLAVSEASGHTMAARRQWLRGRNRGDHRSCHTRRR